MIGNKIHQARLARKMTLKDVGALISKSVATVQRYESRQLANVSYDIVMKLAHELKVSPAYLTGFDEINYF